MRSFSQLWLLDEHMLSQLQAFFSRMENPIILKLLLNESTLSNELKGYMEALALQTDKIKITIEESQQRPYRYKKQSETHYKLHIKLSHYLKRTMKIMLVFSGQHINPSYFHTHISPYLYDLLL